ncbi:MAG: caspase family protein [Nostocaceae cyanobacterium]|nr:caspase family protein [Nostocaceae cyanobacterium]
MSPRGVATSRSKDAQKTRLPKLWLLMVGVNKYQDKQLPNLSYSALDCQGLASTLRESGQQFTEKEVINYNDFAGQLPYLQTVRTSLQKITTTAQTQDTILFYFSGHGMLHPQTGKAFLCCMDTQKDSLEATGLPLQELLYFLSQCPAQQQLVWLDACHSGGMTLRETSRQFVEVLQQRAAKSKGFYALLSCDIDQQSWEFPELGHGVFTYYLMRGLRGEAADSQGVISADGLYRYIYHQTLQYIDKTNQRLRLINQQKRGKGDNQLYSEYPLQTPKRIVEGVGEIILGKIATTTETHALRKALVIEGLTGLPTTLTFSKLLRGNGNFDLEYLFGGKVSADDIRDAIRRCLYSSSKSKNTIPEQATTLLYLRGHLQETPIGETAFLLGEDIWISCSWLRQQLRRSYVSQQIIILDCPGVNSISLQEWVEDLQLDSERGQCILAANSSNDNPEQFTQALIDSLQAANQPTGLSVAGWISQLQVSLAGAFPLHIWLSGTQGVIEIIPATPSGHNNKQTTLDLNICPYQGLRAFGEEDAQYFYGRETLIQHLITHINHNSFLAVVGASGSGKSSVVQAGLVSQLRQGKQFPNSDKWWIKTIRPGKHPLDILAKSLGQGQADILEGMLYQGVEGFVFWLRQRCEPMVMLVVDQFEELFTLAATEDRKRFLELLLGGLEYASDKFKLVITLRADFISSCLEEAKLAKLLQDSSILVPPRLSDEDYRRVIINPAEQVGLEVQTGLVEVLLQELNHSAGDLPLLEFVLQQLWESRQNGKLTLAAYQQQVGGIKGALERKAEAVYKSLDADVQDCAKWIFLCLTQLGEGTEDTRRRVLKSELIVKKYPRELIERTLQALTTAKLVVVNVESEWEKGGGSKTGNSSVDFPISPNGITIEVAHEILIRHWSTLRWWLEENRSRLYLQRQIEQATNLWKQNGEQSDFLLQGVRLGEAEEIYINYTDELSVDVQRFIAACLAERKRQQLEQKKRLRQAQIAVAVISVLGVTATGFGGLAYFKQQAAQIREIAALNASSSALLLSHQQLESLIASLKAGKQLKQEFFAPAKDIQLATVATLQQAISQTLEVNRLQGHSQQVNAIAFSPDGKMIASASDDNTVKVWGVDGKLVNTFKGHKDRVTSIAFSGNGKFIASGSADKTVKIYNFDGKLIKTFSGHGDIVKSISFSPNSQVIASTSSDKTIKIWDINQGLVQSWNADNRWANSVSFSPDGQLIVSGGEDNLVKIWNVKNGELIQSIAGHKERITSVKFSPDGHLIAAGSGDKRVSLYNFNHKSKRAKKELTLTESKEQINSVSFSRDGKFIAAAVEDGTINVWSLDGSLLTTVKGHGAAVNDVSFKYNDGKFLASAGDDKIVRLWQIDSIITPEHNTVYSVVFSPNGKVFASAGWDGKVKIWERNQSGNISQFQEFVAHDNIIDAISFSNDGKFIATASSDNRIKIWDAKNYNFIQEFSGNQDRITSISFSPDGKFIASGGANKTVKIWRLNDGQLLRTIFGHTDVVTSVSFSPNGKFIASGSTDNIAKVWRLDGTLIHSLQGHGLAISQVKFSPNGKILATASWDNSIKLWNVTDGTVINTFTGHTDGVTGLSFTANGGILASGSADSTIKLWNTSKGTLLKTLLGHPGKINSISFNLDDKLLLTGGESAGVKLWNLDLNELIQRGCLRIGNYLRHNPNANREDICNNF